MIEFDHEPNEKTVTIRDTVRRATVDLFTANPIETVREVPDSTLRNPVERAVEFVTDQLSFRYQTNLYVKDPTEVIAAIERGGDGSVPAGSYEIDIEYNSIKLYVGVEDTSIEITQSDDGCLLSFDREMPVVVGARSLHRKPIGTITTTERPDDLIEAVSYFSAALQTTSPERSFPTLRSHPPLVELGEEFAVRPNGAVADGSSLERPDTGIVIEVPRDVASAFTIAPLAFYLGAELEPTDRDRPRLYAGEQTVEFGGAHLSTRQGENVGRTVSEGVATTLRQLFGLDCVVRTEGLYQVELKEREEVERILDAHRCAFDPVALYDLPIEERTERYLSYPIGSIERCFDWYCSADIAPQARRVELLPYLVDDLAEIHSPPRERGIGGRDTTAVSDRLLDRLSGNVVESEQPLLRDGGEIAPASWGETAAAEPIETAQQRCSWDDPSDPETVLSPMNPDTMNHTWVAPYYPMGSVKAIPEAFENRHKSDDSSGDEFRVDVVCNDPSMLGEIELEEVDNRIIRTSELNTDRDIPYGYFEWIRKNVVISEDMTREELRTLIEGGTDFLHFIGHVTDDGMQCVDGYLDCATIEQSNVKTFLLNACRSYEQGEHLIRAGSHGGIVTAERINNNIAMKWGWILASLLDAGFSLNGSLSVIQNELSGPPHYLILGDGTAAMTHSGTGPTATIVEKVNEDKSIVIRQIIYQQTQLRMGYLNTPPTDANEIPLHTLAPGERGTCTLSLDDFLTTFEGYRDPIIINNEIYWADELTIDAIKGLAFEKLR